MKWRKKLKLKVKRWLSPKYQVKLQSEYPEDPKPYVMYLIGERIDPWLVCFRCPCSCGEIINLNLLKDASPVWKVKINKKGKLTIRPSIKRTIGCRSHFFLTQNRIDWFRSFID